MGGTILKGVYTQTLSHTPPSTYTCTHTHALPALIRFFFQRYMKSNFPFRPIFLVLIFSDFALINFAPEHKVLAHKMVLFSFKTDEQRKSFSDSVTVIFGTLLLFFEACSKHNLWTMNSNFAQLRNFAR